MPLFPLFYNEYLQMDTVMNLVFCYFWPSFIVESSDGLTMFVSTAMDKS